MEPHRNAPACPQQQTVADVHQTGRAGNRRDNAMEQQPYVPPEEVTSPQDRWTLIGVLRDGGSGQASYAVGLWDEQVRIACR